MTTITKTRNYSAFYALLKQMPGETKESVVSNFTNHRTESLTALSVTEYADLIKAMKDKIGIDKEYARNKPFDKPRKRLIRSIGAYLEAKGKPNNITSIKSIACRASGHLRFNQIPLARLNSLYAAFNQQTKDIKAVGELNPDAPITELKQQLAEAIETEDYELANVINQRIKQLENN